MAKFQYIGDEPRDYPFLLDGAPLSVVKDDICDLPEDPADGRWVPVKASQKALKDDSAGADAPADPTPSN